MFACLSCGIKYSCTEYGTAAAVSERAADILHLNFHLWSAPDARALFPNNFVVPCFRWAP